MRMVSREEERSFTNGGSSSRVGNAACPVGSDVLRQEKHVVKRVSINVVIVMQEVADTDPLLTEVHEPLRRGLC